MGTRRTISEISRSELELLEAAGWSDPAFLARADPARLRAELAHANDVLKIVPSVPDLATLQSWIERARLVALSPAPILTPRQSAPADDARVRIVEPDEPVDPVLEAAPQPRNGPVEVSSMPHLWSTPNRAPEDEVPAEARDEPVPFAGPSPVAASPTFVNYEADPDVRDMIALAPLAIPIPNRTLAEKGIYPKDIEEAHLLNGASTDLEVRVTTRVRKKVKPRSGTSLRHSGGTVVQVANYQAGTSRRLGSHGIRSVDEVRESPAPKPERRREDERLNLLRTARPETNRGRDPKSRRFIRGVLHDRPAFVWFGCLVVVLLQILVPVSLVTTPLLLMADHIAALSWVPKWFLAFPLSLPVLGLFYFFISTGVKCRVCGQKLLVTRHCRRNKKAHHVPGLGFIFPMALHTMIFRWFNCTFCGTSIRIKE